MFTDVFLQLVKMTAAQLVCTGAVVENSDSKKRRDLKRVGLCALPSFS
jgi:hypothetical protein